MLVIKNQDSLFERNLSSIRWQVYPKIAIMDSNYSHLFPSRKVKKILIRKVDSQKKKNNDLIEIELFEDNNNLKIVNKIKFVIKSTGISF